MAYEKLTMDDVTSITPYSWDGNERPNLADYTSPWEQYASSYEYKSTGTAKRKRHNEAVAYAKNQIQLAMAQYEQDIAFWNERDERDYTDPVSQTNRYKEAGYNLGYLYGNVDSGNSAVGYDQPDSSFEPAEVKGDELRGVEVASKVVSTVFDVVTSLVKSGVSLVKLPAELAKLASETASNEASARVSSAVATIKEYMNSHDMAGNVSSLTDSFSMAIEQMNYTLNQNRSNESFWNAEVQKKFSSYCESIWQQQSTGNSYQEALKWIDNLPAPDWLKGTLAGVVTVFDLAKGFKGSKSKKN